MATTTSSTIGDPTGVVLDIQGTLVDGRNRALPGAPEAVANLKSAGIPVVLASNKTSTTRDRLTEELQAEGFDIEPGDVVTTASLTAAYLRERHPGARIRLFADSNPLAGEDGLNLVEDNPDVVVLTGAGKWVSSEALSAIAQDVSGGATLVAMHRNLTWMGPSGLALDVGALLPGIETATGSEARVIGKPSPSFFEHALASKGISASGAVMVGDDIDSDILAAQSLGLTGILVRTGKFRPEALARASGSPNFVIDAVANLDEVLGWL